MIGDWIRRCKRRKEVILMTKGGHPKFARPEDGLHIPRMAPEDMRYDIGLSLKTLGADCIDMVFSTKETCPRVFHDLDFCEGHIDFIKGLKAVCPEGVGMLVTELLDDHREEWTNLLRVFRRSFVI